MAAGHRMHRERALDLTRDRGIARARDFKAAGIPLVYLKRLTLSGDLIKLGRGLYQTPEHAAPTPPMISPRPRGCFQTAW